MSDVPPPDALTTPKYVVHLDDVGMTELEAGTFIVLRSSDVFAPAALFAYASAVESALTLEATLGVEMFTDEQRAHLHRTAAELNEAGIVWSKLDQKVPD